jgi:hypothetical protein
MRMVHSWQRARPGGAGGSSSGSTASAGSTRCSGSWSMVALRQRELAFRAHFAHAAPTPCSREDSTALPPLRRALAAGPAPVLVAGRAPAEPKLPLGLATRLTGVRGARRPHVLRALHAVAMPVLVAGGAPAERQPSGRSPALAAGPHGRGRPRGMGWPLDLVPAPVHLAHPAAPLNEGIVGREATPTDATGPCGHPSPSSGILRRATGFLVPARGYAVQWRWITSRSRDSVHSWPHSEHRHLQKDAVSM